MENQDYDENLNSLDSSMSNNDNNDDNGNNDNDDYQNSIKNTTNESLMVDTPNINNIKEKLENFKNIKIDFTNFEAEYSNVFNINETLTHSLSVLYENLEILTKEENKMVQGMKKAGIYEDDLSSKAWRPLALIREKIMYIFVEVKDILILTNDFNLSLAFKLRNSLIENKGMAINKELTARQIELSEITSKNQMDFFNKVLDDRKETELERTQIFERTIGNLVGMIQDVKSTKIKNMIDGCESVKKEIVDKEKIIKIQEEKDDNSEKIIEKLNKEIRTLKQNNSFNLGYIEKFGESKELKKDTNILNNERIDNFLSEISVNNEHVNNELKKIVGNQDFNSQSVNIESNNSESIDNQLKNIVDNKQIFSKNENVIKDDSGSVIDELKIERQKSIIYKQLESQDSLNKILRQKDMLVSSYNDIGDKKVSKLVEIICKEIIKKRGW